MGSSITPIPPRLDGSPPPLIAAQPQNQPVGGYQATDPIGPMVLIYPEAEPMTYEDYVFYKRNSAILGNNLDQGVSGVREPDPKPGDGYEPHHMIPSGDKRATDLRNRLADAGIDINDAVNGVWLPKNDDVAINGETPHNETMRQSYFIELERRFEGVNTREGFDAALSKLRDDLKNRSIDLPRSKP